MSNPIPVDDPALEKIAKVLTSAYGLREDIHLTRLNIGQGTFNYRAITQGRSLFVKHYQADDDLAAEAEAVALTQLAGRHGVPVAEVLCSTAGEAISRQGDRAISVWTWMSGHTMTGGLNQAQHAAAGQTLGRIHRTFAGHPAGRKPSSELHNWLNPDLTQLQTSIDKLLGIIKDRTTHDSFDKVAAGTLTERRADLRRVPGLLAGLDEFGALNCQVLHGDYSAVNLLFDGDKLTAVLDFRPPAPFLVSYEIGRIAFDPRTVVLKDDWITSAVVFVNSYVRENLEVGAANVRICARIALIQLLTSLYGVKNHYLKPGLLQGDLDDFWLLRHRAAQRLAEHLGEVEAALIEAAAYERDMM